jgi:hypothetical protein
MNEICRLGAVVLALTSMFAVPRSLTADEPARCQWVFSGGGMQQDKTRAVTFDRTGNVLLAAECVGDAKFGPLQYAGRGGMDMCLAKLDPQGKVLWVSGLGGSKTERAYGVVADAAGNAYVTGHFESTDIAVDGGTLGNGGGYDVFTAKFAPDGRLVWVRTGGGDGYDYGHAVALDPKGDVVVAGSVQGNAKFGDQSIESAGKGRAIFCAKYDADGKLLWLRSTSGTLSGSGHGVAVDAAGGIYIGGNATGQGTFGTVAIESKTAAAVAVKLTPDGDAVWASTITGTPSALYHEIACDSSGRVWGVGMFKGTVTVAGQTFSSPGPDDNDGLIVHLDASGRPQWARHLHGVGTNYCLGVATDDHGTSFVCGDFHGEAQLAGRSLTSRGSGDIFLAAFDAAGELLWLQQAGGALNDTAYPLAFRAPDEIAIGGSLGLPARFDGIELTTPTKVDLYGAKWKLPPRK